MTKLSDTQAIILSAAAQRPDGNILPLPGSLRGGAATKVVGALLSRGLIREHVVDSPRKADAAMNTIWRNLPSRTAAASCFSSPLPGSRPSASSRRPRPARPTGADETPGEEGAPDTPTDADPRAQGAHAATRARSRRG